MWRLGWWSLLLPSLQGQWHDSLNMTCLRLQVFGQMTWDIKRVFPYYKRTQVLKDLKTPTPRKTDTSPETTHCRPDHVMSRDICPHRSRDFLLSNSVLSHAICLDVRERGFSSRFRFHYRNPDRRVATQQRGHWFYPSRRGGHKVREIRKYLPNFGQEEKPMLLPALPVWRRSCPPPQNHKRNLY